MLHRCRVEIGADAFEQRFALIAIVAMHADLDELVREEIHVDLVEDRGGEPMLSDGHDGMKRMRLRAKGAALAGC